MPRLLRAQAQVQNHEPQRLGWRRYRASGILDRTLLGSGTTGLCSTCPGRNFDKNGNMLDWWSNFSAHHFRQQSECMIHQYGNYSWDLADNQNVSGGPPAPA